MRDASGSIPCIKRHESDGASHAATYSQVLTLPQQLLAADVPALFMSAWIFMLSRCQHHVCVAPMPVPAG